MKSGKKLDIKSLAKLLSSGLRESKTEFDKKEFGLAAMAMYDYKNDIREFQYGPNKGEYFRNLVYQDDQISLINIIWNPLSVSPIHGHPSKG